MDPNSLRLLMGSAGGGATENTYIEDVFSTWLYAGNGSTQTITNGIDLSGKGGLTWIKGRSGITGHRFVDTVRGATKSLESNATAPEATESNGLTAFSSTGFSLGADADYNTNLATYTSWTFRKAAKFFDVVTYTGDGTSPRNISHSLGSTPGFIIVKSTGGVSNWWCWHRSISTGDLSSNTLIVLNATSAQTNVSTLLGTASSTTFQVGGNTTINAPGGTYVAYLFAHDAGGFGDSGNDNVISCGSYTGNGSTIGPTVTLGWEPQWLLIKRANSIGDWHLIDNLRGFVVGGTDAELNPNLNSAESSGTFVSPLATGFQLNTTNSGYNGSGSTYIYIAIRRGPMKTPTDPTKVFNQVARTGTGANATVSGGQLTDLAIIKSNLSTNSWVWVPRLNNNQFLSSDLDVGATTAGSTILQTNPWDSMVGVKVGTTSTLTNSSGSAYINYLLGRAPGFFDVVNYTGNGVATTTINHNLGVTPELMLIKRTNGTAVSWAVTSSVLASNEYLKLQTTSAVLIDNTVLNNTRPTATVFTVGTSPLTNSNNNRYINYLFASCPGVSKVGSYTGTGTTLSIDCGFTAGARFVVIKRIDGTPSWYVWDTARGIVSGNDPYLFFNSSGAESGTFDYIDPLSSGFQISSTAPTAINASGGTYLYLAIA